MVLLQCQLELSSWRPSQHSTLETCFVGGKQLHARHTVGRVLLAFPPFKSLFMLCSSLAAVFDYTCIFAPLCLWRGKIGVWGGSYILVWGRSLHLPGRFSYLHDSCLDWEGLSANHIHLCMALTVYADANHAHRIHIYVCACACSLLLDTSCSSSCFSSPSAFFTSCRENNHVD